MEYLLSGNLEAADAVSGALQPCESVPVPDQIPVPHQICAEWVNFAPSGFVLDQILFLLW